MLRPSSHPCTDVDYLQDCKLTLQGDSCMLGLLLQQSSPSSAAVALVWVHSCSLQDDCWCRIASAARIFGCTG